MDTKNKELREIIVFMILMITLSSLAYIPIILAGTIHGEYSNLASFLMLAPGLAAAITYLIFERSLCLVSWRLGKIRYLFLGLVIPLIYCLFEYSLVWLIGWGQYNGQLPSNLLAFISTLLLKGTFSGLLEEVAWRGFLVPKMMKLTSFNNTAILTGLIWAFWHYPLILFTDSRPKNVPLLICLICFTIFVTGLSFLAAWLRMESGSVWTAALLHGSHNVFMLHVFNSLTIDTGNTWFFAGEYGIVTACVGIILAILIWGLQAYSTRRRNTWQILTYYKTTTL